MKIVARVMLGMLLLLLIAAVITNPGMERFKQEVRSRLQQEIEKETSNPSLQYIADLGMEFTDNVVEKLVVRHNYFLCSVFQVDLPDGTYRYVGAYGTFYPLQEKDPFQSLASF